MPLNFYATFTNGTNNGVTGLVPLITITKISLSSGTNTNVLINGTMSPVTNCSGMYFYNMTASADLTSFDYAASIVTNSTVSVDTPFAASLWSQFGVQASMAQINGMTISFTDSTMTAGTQQINTNAALLGGVATTLGLVSGGLSFNGTNSMFDTNFYAEGPAVMDIQTASYDYRFLVLVKNQQGQLVDPDTNTIGTDASNDAGVSRNAGLSLVGGVRKCVRESTGRYTCTYTVAPSDAVETIRINFNGTATNAGITFGRYSSIVSAVVDPTSSGGSGLSGPNTVTVTFFDASGTLGVANVPFTIPGQGVGRANSSGIATFGLPTDSTSGYTVIGQITDNILFPSTAFTVNGATTVSVIGSTVVIPHPSSPSDCTIYFYTVDQAGSVTGGINVAWELANPDDDTVVGNGTSNSAAMTGLWSLDVRIPATGTTYVRITTPTRNFDAAIPYTTTPGSSLKIAGP